jgi:hypothetical protein
MRLHRVQVWFGEHLIIDHTDEETTAATFEQAMRRRFPSLVVTRQPIRPSDALVLR